jgi:hypothetical protein
MESGFYNLRGPSRSSKRTFLAILSVVGLIGLIGLISLYRTSNLSFSSINTYNLGETEFGEFIRKHNKYYESNFEYKLRLEIYRRNLEFINAHNNKGLSWKLAVNEFADLTFDEFKYRMGIRPINIPENLEETELPATELPEKIDWEAEGKVTPIKDQGQCGSCWAFSTTGAIEGAWAIANKDLVSLSEQQLVDCSTEYGNMGCNGGLMNYAFTYVIDIGGIEGEEDYPYKAVENVCSADSSKIKAKISKYANVKRFSEAALKQAVAQQPVSIAVQADEPAWQFYKEGVVTSDCGKQVDHGVLIVGYGEENGIPYWKVKNSWGPHWGDKGYIKIKRDESSRDGGVCGISSFPSYPVV